MIPKVSVTYTDTVLSIKKSASPSQLRTNRSRRTCHLGKVFTVRPQSSSLSDTITSCPVFIAESSQGSTPMPSQGDEKMSALVITMSLETIDTSHFHYHHLEAAYLQHFTIPSQTPNLSPNDVDLCIRPCLCHSSIGLRRLLWTPR